MLFQICRKQDKTSKFIEMKIIFFFFGFCFNLVFSISDDGSVMTEFQKTPLMSTYLIAFMVSDFEYKENKMSFDGTTFRHRVFAKPTEVKNTGYALDEGEHILNAIANYVQIYFSLPKMDQAAIPEFRAGGWNFIFIFFWSFLSFISICSNGKLGTCHIQRRIFAIQAK